MGVFYTIVNQATEEFNIILPPALLKDGISNLNLNHLKFEFDEDPCCIHKMHRQQSTMNVNKPVSSLRTHHLCPTNRPMSKSFYIILAIAIGAAGLIFIDNQKGYYLKTSLRKSAASTDNIGLASSSGTTDILQLRAPKEADGDIVSNEDDGEEPPLESVVAVSEFETTVGTSDVTHNII